MSKTVTVEYLANNMTKLLRELEAGTNDAVIIVDGQTVTEGVGATPSNTKLFSQGSAVGKMVPLAAFNAANAGGAIDISYDAATHVQTQSGGWDRNAIYELIQSLRRLQAEGSGGATSGSLLVAGADANGDILYTAVSPGPGSTAITIEHVVAGNNTLRSIDVTGSAIVVNVATDGGGAVEVTETATSIAASVNSDPDASALVSAAAQGTGASLVAAAAEDALSAGTDPAGTGGPNAIGIKRTKNATDPQAVLVSAALATDIGL